MLTDYIIEHPKELDSNIDNLVKLLTSAFQDDEASRKEGASIILLEDNFRLIFGAPSRDNETFLQVRYKPTNEIIGFLGAIRKKLLIEGKIYSASIPAWLSVHEKHRKKGISTELGKKMIEIAKNNYDVAVAFHDASQHGLDASKAISRETGVPLTLLTFMKKYIVRVFDVKSTATVIKATWYQKIYFKFKERIGKVNNPHVRLYKPTDIDQVFNISMELSKRNQVAIVHDFEDLKWKLNNPIVLCVVHENDQGKIDGFINCWEFLLSGFGKSVKFGWLDTVHSYNLKDNETKSLANLLCNEAKKRGWKGLQTPYIPYFKAKPFKKANFAFFTKKIGLYLYNIKNIPLPNKVNSIYFEWR